MKIFLKILKNMLIFLAALFIVLVLFLYVFYDISYRNLRKQERHASEMAAKQKVIVPEAAAAKEPAVLNLIPVPRKVIMGKGTLKLPETLRFQVQSDLKHLVAEYLTGLPGIRPLNTGAGAFLNCVADTSLPEQGYRLELNPGSAILAYGSKQGLHYGLVTLKVLMRNYNNNIPCLLIEDYPDLAVRGLMIDISRNKVPTLETLKAVAQLLADLKYNHLELYIEGFSFGYPSFKHLCEGTETPLTGAEIRELDAFCRQNYIDLVPNQNSLGHMTSWLATEEFSDLAECPKGYKLMGLIDMKGTLDPYDPRSVELLTRMTDDLLPNFTSEFYNMNLDEPFELGLGKSRKISRKLGVGNVYLDYVKKMHEIATARNKKMLLWGDIVLKHKEIVSQLPGDVTLLDWGYEAEYPFERNCRMLDSARIQFMVCPGTSSWTSITGRTDNMMKNIENAAVNGTRYGARGLVVTDWGDMGHWQYLPVSYAGYITAGALSWNSASMQQMPLPQFLGSYVFRDSSGMGEMVLNMGRYNRYEEFAMFNMTTTMLAFQFGLRDKVMINGIFGAIVKGLTTLMKEIAPDLINNALSRINNRKTYDYNGLMKFLDDQEVLLAATNLDIPDGALVKEEYSNAIRLIRLGADLKQYINGRDTASIAVEKEQLEKMNRWCTEYLKENKRLWIARNKPGGYDLSIASLVTLQEQIRQRILLLQQPLPSRTWNRFLEKISTSATIIYLKMV